MLVLIFSGNHQDQDRCGTTLITCKWLSRLQPTSGSLCHQQTVSSLFAFIRQYLWQRRPLNPCFLHTPLSAAETVHIEPSELSHRTESSLSLQSKDTVRFYFIISFNLTIFKAIENFYLKIRVKVDSMEF